MRSRLAILVACVMLCTLLAAQKSAKPDAPIATHDDLQSVRLLVKQQQFGQAERELDHVIASKPQSSEALYLLAFVYFREDRPAESLKTATRAAAIREPLADDLKIVGLDYALLNDYVSSAKYLRMAVEREPNNREALYHLGRVLYVQNQFDEAIAMFRRVLALDPDDVKAMTNLGLAFEGKNDSDAAVKIYREAIAADGAAAKHTERPYYELGRLLSVRGDTAGSVRLLAKATELNARCAECFVELGKCHSNSGELSAARKDLERAVAIDDRNIAAHYALARVYKRLQLGELAAKELARTEELNQRRDKTQ